MRTNMREPIIIRGHEKSQRIKLRGQIRVFEQEKPENLIYKADNAIVVTVKSLFARLLANNNEPLFGVWGLALGSGDANWAADSIPPEATPLGNVNNQPTLLTQILRKKLNSAHFVDADLNPTVTITNQVDFQTIVNATTDGIPSNTGIREMGLIGGGSAAIPTDMLTAPYYDPTAPSADSVVLINYKTLPSLILPPGVNLIFSWVLTF